MIPVAERRRESSALAVFFTIILNSILLTQASPTVTVGASRSGNLLMVTMTASGFPEIRNISIECRYDPGLISIMDAVVGSPVTAAALGLRVDTSSCRLYISISASSAVTIGDGKQLAFLNIPLKSQQADNVFFVSGVGLTDKNGSTVEAAIKSTAVVAKMREAYYSYLSYVDSKNIRDGFLLDGKCLLSGLNNYAPGLVVRKAGKTAHHRSVIVVERRHIPAAGIKQ